MVQKKQFDFAEAARLYAGGATSTELAVRYETTSNTVVKALREQGVEIRSKSARARHYVTNEGFFDRIDTPAKAYLLGAICSDGNVVPAGRGHGSCIRMEVAESDRELVDLFHQYLGGPPPGSTQPRTNRVNSSITWRTSVSSERLVSGLARVGVGPAKSLTVTLRWQLIPVDLHRFVVLGLVDGDGSWHRDKERSLSMMRLATGSLALAEQLLAIIPGSTMIRSKKLNHNDCYHVRVKGVRAMPTFIRWLYDSHNQPSITRKRDKALAILADMESRIPWGHSPTRKRACPI